MFLVQIFVSFVDMLRMFLGKQNIVVFEVDGHILSENVNILDNPTDRLQSLFSS